MIFSKIAGTGSYLPINKLSNHDLEKYLDTTDAWIVERTGIRSRHIANAAETTTFMAVKAAQNALHRANTSIEHVDLILVATCTPDKIFPATACLVQEALSARPCAAFDVQAACSGFIYALSIADQFIQGGKSKCALVIGSETMSRAIDRSDRRTAILFGDGAGAFVLKASKEPGILSTHINADGQHKDILFFDNQPGAFIQMQGNPVFRLAVNMLDQVAVDALVKQNMSIQDIDWLVPHQANIRIIQAMADKLKFPMERIVLTLETQGNTSAASIPIALHTYVELGKIQQGQHLLLEAFGGGLTWGTALVRF